MSNKDYRAALKRDQRWLQDYTNRLLANLLVRVISLTPIKPNHVTLISLLFGLCAAYLLLLPKADIRIYGSALLFFSLVLDSADGQLARYKNLHSGFGRWFDQITDRIKEVSIVLSITYSYTARFQITWLWIIALTAVFITDMMHYNSRILEIIFDVKAYQIWVQNLILRNITSFGYGERIIYLSIFSALDLGPVILIIINTLGLFHIIINSYKAIIIAKKED